MTRELIELTPEMAADLLSRPHPKQRSTSRQVVESISRALREGRWRLIDDPILVVGPTHAGPADPLGSMFNGRHRCSAVVATGIPMLIWIDRDADPSTFDVIDTGHKRAAHQFVGQQYASQRAAAARLLLWYERRFDRPPGGVNLVFDLHEVLAAVEEHEEVLTAVLAMACQTAEYTGLAPSVVTAVYALASEMGYHDQIASFAEGVVEPGSLAPGSPPRLLSDRFRKQVHRARRRSSVEDWTILTRAVNLHIQGRSAAKLVLGSVWPLVAESEAEFRNRTASTTRAKQHDGVRAARKAV